MAADTNDQSRRLSEQYLALLLDSKRGQAIDLVMGSVDEGLPIPAVYLELIQPAMYELGRLWQNDEIDIGTEHYCTAATQLLMARLFPLVLQQKRLSRSMIGCCVGSELHELGMRMVCDFFEFEGWDTYFMGANTPGSSILKVLQTRSVDLVCISATMGLGIATIRDISHLLREKLGPRCPKIMAGGLPFLINPHLASAVGADATARDARHAVAVAARLLEMEAAC